MKKRITALLTAAVLLTGICGCDRGEISNDKDVEDSADSYVETYYPDHEEYVIKYVKVKEQPLSEIKTHEDDIYAQNHNTREPFIDDNGGVYHYVSCMGDGDTPEFMHYDDGSGIKVRLDLPESSLFKGGVVRDGAFYGLGTEEILCEESDGKIRGHYENFIMKNKNGKTQKLPLSDDGSAVSVTDCYFAEEGIYYQRNDTIFLMDYDGKNSRKLFEIPVELNECSDIWCVDFVVYRGVFWYSCAKSSYPLWCYDFKGTFTAFDKGGLGAVNNGFLYYQEQYPAPNSLYRFDCVNYTVELVKAVDDSISHINSYAFAPDDFIIYAAWERETDTSYAYRMNNSEDKKILAPNKLRLSEDVLTVSCKNNRIFATGSRENSYTCLCEIDINGNVIKDIHEDAYSNEYRVFQYQIK